MARINVSERDLSWHVPQRESSFVIYMLGTSTWGPIDRPVLCSSASQFVKTFGSAVVSDGLNLSYDMALSFIKSGASVLFQRVVDGSCLRASVTPTDTDLTIQSKYFGSHINGYTVSFTKSANKDGYLVAAEVSVNDETGKVVERFHVDFVDPTSVSYYKNADISKFVGFESDIARIKESEVEAEYTFVGGRDSETFDGVVSTIASWEESGDEKTLKTNSALEIVADLYNYDFDVITAAGFSRKKDTEGDMNPVDAALWNLAEARKNVLFLVDGAVDMSADEFYGYCGKFDTSYAAGVGPWGYAQIQSTGVTALLPGSYAHLITWVRSISEGTPAWTAPAGIKRASLGGFYVRPAYEIGRSIVDTWQGTDDDDGEAGFYRVNPIMKVKNYGYVVYGNSTLLHNRGDQTSMLQSISTRVAVNLIKRKAFDISTSLQFDQMSDTLYAHFATEMDSYLEALKSQGALYSYRIALDEDSATINHLNERTLPVLIQISPTPAAENFDITLEITKSGVTLTDSGEAGSSEAI